MNTITSLTALMMATATASYAEPAGYQPLTFEAAHHADPVSGAIWYPAGGGGTARLFADNPVFQGTDVLEGATVAEGSHPVVLLSHGFGGGVESVAWLGTALAEAGAIVIAVNHPNTTWRDFDIVAGADHWTRPMDLSAALDVVSDAADFDGKFDLEAVAAVGFSYGGWTALSLGGAQSNHAGFVTHCAAFGVASTYCGVLEDNGVDISALDAVGWDGSYGDPRVTSVVALDPGLVWEVAAQDLTDLVADVHLIGLGDGDDRLLAADFDASGFAEMLPEAEVTRIVPGVHFTGMPLCKPAGAAILAAEEDDPVCTDPQGTDRGAVHDQIVRIVLDDLGL